jgi:predicted nuclease of predicted toxin-antitoxin system
LKVKPDENLGRRSIELFKESGHEVSTVTEQQLGGTSDDEFIEVCRVEDRVLVTLDLDFSNVLRFPPQKYAGIVVLRVPHPIELADIYERVRTLLKASEGEELDSKLWIVEQDRVREYAPK